MNEKIKYYKGSKLIAFYKENKETEDEELVSVFSNVNEILKYKKFDQDRLPEIRIKLCLALKKNPPYTRLLDGTKMKVYLIDIND